MKNRSKPWKSHRSRGCHIDEIYKNQVIQSVQEWIARIQTTDTELTSIDSDLEKIKGLSSASESTKNELVSLIEVKTVSDDDACVFRCLKSLFTYISLIEEIIKISNFDAHKYEASTISIQIWNDATHAISIMRTKYPDYTYRKSLKSFGSEIQKSCDIIINALENSFATLKEKKNDSELFNNYAKTEKIISISEHLLEFIPIFGAYLDHIEHVERLVSDSLLAMLEMDTRNNELISDSKLLRLQISSFECIDRILKWKQNSSSLLIYHLGSGEERRMMETSRCHDFRERIWKCFHQALTTEFNHTEEHYFFLRSSCRCITTLFENVHRLSNIKSRSDQEHKQCDKFPNEIELAHAFKWIHEVIQLDTPAFATDCISLKCCSLDLLRTLMLMFPKFCAQFWALFLPQKHSTQSTIKLNSFSSLTSHQNVNLLTIIDDKKAYTVARLNEKDLALKCSKQIVSSLPLRLWSSSGYMSSRIEVSLEEVIKATTKNLCREIPVKELQATYSLAETLIMCIPYDKYKSLTQVATNLIYNIGKKYTLYGLHGGIGLIENAITLTECLGGKETPGGYSTPLPLPSKLWLEGESSASFLDRLYSIISEIATCDAIEKGTEAMVQMDLFIRLIRIMPNLMRTDVFMETFSTLTWKLLSSSDNKLQFTGAMLVRSFVEGRKDGRNIPIMISAKLRNLLILGDSSVKCCILGVYGALRLSEWNVLLFDRNSPIDLILPLCLESNNPLEKVRSEACKALGNMISVCMNDLNSEVVDDILDATLEDTINNIVKVTALAVQDSDANVRSMALFAIGNIAQDISRSKKFTTVRIPLLDLCDTTYQRLFDDGDKVISNAIRTAGHLFKLISSSEKELGLHDNLQWLHLCGDFALELGKKINQAISDSINSSKDRSWKQRSASKKHAWGSCQALQSVLLSSAAMKSINSDGVTFAAEGIISCISYSDKLNEKIVYGAMETLLTMPPQLWSRLSRNVKLKGRCMAICLSKLQSMESRGSLRIYCEKIMSHLLRNSDDEELLNLFELSDVNQLNFLYKWMVHLHFESTLFMSCFRVLQSHRYDDVALMQRYASRAMLEARKDISNTSYSGGTEIVMEDDDEEDEL